ncbi:MAG: ABC transporter substrate-binding protein [Alphaproteobacteria bacterium]|nr:ABC transporter substrate-binding protein [Alphaproteobacteria bacterium]
MGAIDQKEFMIAMMGEDTSLWSVPMGDFPPASPLASDAGLSALTAPRDYPAVEKALQAAGYKGETLVLMVPTDQPTLKALSDVAADTLKRVGMNVDYQATDWGMVVQRRASTKPPSDGGWNLFCTGFSGLDWFSPASHLPLRGNGKDAWFGWPTMPKMEALRADWFDAADPAEQKKIGAETQLQGFEDVPFYPLGVAQLPTAFRPELSDVAEGFPIFWSVRRT